MLSRICIVFIFSFSCFTIKAQSGLYINGNNSSFYVGNNSTVYVNGDLQNLNNNPNDGFTNNGTVVLTGNFVNNDSLYNDRVVGTIGSTFIFSGLDTQTISGTASIPFFKLQINKPNGSEIKLQRNIYIKDTLRFINGNIDLNGKIVEMVYSGNPPSQRNPFIYNETSAHYIYGNSGYVFVSTIKDVGKPNNLANIGLSIPDNDSKTISIKRYHTQQVYAGSGSIKKYFDVTSNAPLNTNSSDSLFIHYLNNYDFSGLSINRNNFQLFVSAGTDRYYTQLPSSHLFSIDDVHAKTEDITLADVPVDLQQFRITVADNTCNNAPISLLTTDTVHICNGDSLLLDAGNQTSVPATSLRWIWSTGKTTQSIVIKPTLDHQTITIKLVDARGCITKDTIIIAPTSPTPSAAFTPYSVCIYDSVLIRNTSSIASGNFTSHWQFGDGNISDTGAILFRKYYTAAGKYYINLTNTSNYGCVSERLDSVNVFPQPKAGFISSYNCSTDKLEFLDSSVANYGSIKNWFWNTGENAGDTVRINSYTSPMLEKSYTTAGNYTVNLIVTTFQGCKDTIAKQVTIYQKIQPVFSVLNGCVGDSLQFFNNSVCNTGSCNYEWNFGDESTSTEFDPRKKYLSAGEFNIKLKITDAQGCADSLSKTIHINPLPVAAFSVSDTDICLGNYIYFTNQSNIVSGNLTYTWAFGNGIEANSVNASQNYLLPAVYNITLTAISDSGCSAQIVHTVIVINNPVAQYEVDPVCYGEATVFNSTSIGTNLSYNWNFGNSVTSISDDPSTTYSSAGSYNTQLIITDNYGCVDTAFQTAIVHTLPAASLGGTITTCGSSYILDAGNSGFSYVWLPVNTTTQMLTVTQDDTYTLQIIDINGCRNNENVTVLLNVPLIPHLGNDTVACGNYMADAGYPGSNYLWNTSQTTRQINIVTSGNYFVRITDQNNCIGYDTIQVGINPRPSISLGNDITQCENTIPVMLNPVSSASQFLWSTGSTMLSLSVNQSGLYWMIAIDSNNCKAYDTVLVNLLPSPSVNLGTDIKVCSNALLDAQNIGNNYLWITGSTTQTLNVKNTGNYWVTVTNPANGCADNDTIHVTIDIPPVVNLGNDTLVCTNGSLLLNALNNGSSYIWSNGKTTQTITVTNSGTYGVTITKETCTAIDFIIVHIQPIPIVDIGNGIQYLCPASELQLTANAATSYAWGSDVGFTSFMQNINVTQTGTYWVTINKNGCTASDTVQIIASPYPITAYFLAATTDTVNKPVQFIELSEPPPITYWWDFGDGFYSTDANPIHIFTQAMAFNVTLEVSNGYCTDRMNKTLTLLKKSNALIHQPAAMLEIIDFNMYPNPANNNVYLKILMNDSAPLQVYMYDINGRLVFQQNAGSVMEYSQNINIAQLPAGFYVVKLIAQSAKGIIDRSAKMVKVY